ncbi:M48 family metalloprotease [Aliiroseovarius subalbicans]|uniref:M48 family metalloprotease n=1 Tax=Aliiroseovarius subalbicans TaxID=2925840 RepID=UPI001F5ACAA6|nr:M48 family metalloprotease [Aliiroseovarius subalbicans]MCI2398067.1 M48 family metalloprotease [Aliiroseovarius subalbicans]
MAGKWIAAGLAMVVAITLAVAAEARATIIRDPDIEHALSELARPLINAAGLSPSRVQILVIRDDKLNAFVADQDHVFINSGLILRLKSPAELQSVIAHELAHIANGHLSRRAANYQAAQNAAKMGLLLAAVAASAGGGKAAVGLAVGTASSAQRLFLAHTRAEEASADQSALRYLAANRIDPQAMVDVLEVFRGQEALSVGRRDPYALTHPLNRDRIRAVKGYAAAGKARAQERPDDAYWFARAQGKLEAFIRAPKVTLRKVGRKVGQGSELERIRRAVALHRLPKPDQAIAEIGALVAAKPNDPYLAELQGQILLESRQFNAAVTAYGRAARLAPRNALVLGGYGRALLAVNSADSNARALGVLRKAYGRDPYSPIMLRDLGLAYARAGQPGMASVVTAERYALIGRLKDAVPHAKRAQGLLPRGSGGWTRAEDILYAAQVAAK